MSASREKKIRQDMTAQGPDSQAQKKQKEAKEAHRSNVLYATIGIICAVFAVCLLVWNSGLIQRNVAAVTIQGEKYTATDVQYYFNTTRSSILNFYLNNFGMLPFDYNTSTKEQVYDTETGETWYDYLLEQAVDTMSANAAIYAKAEAEGFVLSEESKAQLDSSLEELKTAWIGTSYTSLKAYIRANFGPYMNYDRLVKLAARDQLVRDYVASVQEGFTYGDADYQAYYQENADQLDTFTITQFTFRASAATTDDQGNTIEMTDEEKAAALEDAKAQAKAKAEDLQARLVSGEDAAALAEEYKEDLYSSSVSETRLGSNVNSSYRDWAWDSARQSGDVTLSEYDGDTSYNYYVVRFEGRQLDQTATANVRHILVKAETDEGASEPTQAQYDAAKAEAEDLLAQWQAGEATEESFAALAQEKSADSGSAANGGLIPNISASSNYVDSFKNWALDAGRRIGDAELVQSSYGWHIMYYVGDGDPVWKQTADSALRSQSYTDWETETMEGWEASNGMGMKFVQG